ncbi:SWIM zinc finger family protein [Streptomyces sp. NPDC051987]|uniref:SWIM zinc finger family protein n=1 Tax=Streptomyces sp. NPDC051987 TaxID=3155808 RepID=UPI00342F76EE
MSGEGEQRPADAARRALRAARDHAAESGGDGAAPGEEARTRAGRAPRPGDAARLALRAAATAQEAGRREGETDSEHGPEAPSGADREDRADTGAPAAVRPGRRPGDVARQALRAARAEAKRAEEAAAAQAADHPPARPARRPPPPSPAPAAAARGRTAHDLRQFLATAFQMPRDEPEPSPAERNAVAASAGGPVSGRNVVGPHAAEPNAAEPVSGAGAAEPDPAERESERDAVGTEGEVEPDPVESGPRPAADRPAPAAPDPALSAAPRLPRTMGTPHRDSELRRTFAARPALTRGEPAASPGFAETWWGNAWVRALEEGALDVKRLVRGRDYAARGHVDAITVTPGLVLAYVQGSRPRPYRVQVRLRPFGEDEWERLLETAADRPADIAALLDKELPQSLAECGVSLLPGPGELEPRCSCPDFGHPCKHAAALCYQTARLLDADPFVLLLLRGRGEREVLDALSRRNAARAARERQPASLPGVRATEALAPRQRPPLPPPMPVPPHPEQPPVYPGVPGGPDPFALDQLATDAAARAHALLTTGRDPVGDLTLWQDAVRLAAGRPGSGLTASTRALYATLADAVGRTPGDLACAVAAWRQGGPEGLAVLEEPWDPPAGRFDRARPLLLAADLPAFRPWRNHLTHPGGHLQLRFGRDGLWYAYESEPGHDDWWPRGTPDLDPVGALTGLGGSDDLPA